MDTGEHSFSFSQPLSISSSRFPLLANYESKFQICVLFLHFLVLQLWHFDFSFIKVLLAFCSLYIWNFGLNSPQMNISKEPNGRFGRILHFLSLSQKHPRQNSNNHELVAYHPNNWNWVFDYQNWNNYWNNNFICWWSIL